MDLHRLVVFEFGKDYQKLLSFRQSALGHNESSTQAYVLSERTAGLAPDHIVERRYKGLSRMFSASLVLQEPFFQEHQKSSSFIVRHGRYELKKLVGDGRVLKIFIY